MQLIKNLFRQMLRRPAAGEGRAPRTAHDEKMMRLYAPFVPRGALCFDVGANIGNRVKTFLELQARVIAFEPQDDCANTLRERYGNDRRLTLVEKALGEAEGEAEIMISNANTISSLSAEWIEAVKSSGRFAKFRWDRKKTVAVTTLDRMIEEYGMPSFIKIDVEGFEYQVIRGLSQPVRTLSLEFTPEFIESTFKCIGHLQRLGDIRLNYSVGESMQLSLPEWVTAQEMIAILSGLKDDHRLFGDVYVQFTNCQASSAAPSSSQVTSSRVYVCLAGGLGNQLFQYAFARYLATQGIAVHGLVVNPFDREPYARRLLVDTLSRIPSVKLSNDELAGLKVIANNNGLTVRDALLESGRTAAVCQGYWQDARYADAVAAELAGDLKAYGERHHSHSRAAAVDCVVHVRRHDYGHFGLLPLAYYLAALEHCGWPRFSVVTDEPNFCEHVFARVQGYAGVVRGDAADPWSDFFLMSNSGIQVIANSSFSWWTAWLGRATGTTKTVIAPGEWSLLKTGNPCPADWHRIGSPLTQP